MTLDLKKISTCHEYWDENKVPIKPDGNAGDALHRVGLQWIEWWLRSRENPEWWEPLKNEIETQARLFHLGQGDFARYYKAINENTWWMRNCFSRDQSIPIIIGFGLWGMYDWVDMIYNGLKLRNGFYTNTVINNKPGTQKIPDFATKAIWGLLDKAKGFDKSGSINDGDIDELIGSYLIRMKASKPKIWIPWPIKEWWYPLGEAEHHSDPVNKTMILIFNKILNKESDTAKNARIVYATAEFKNYNLVEYSWKKYWNRKTDIQCPFDKFFMPYVKALAKDEIL